MSAVSAESPRGSADLIPSSASTPGGQAPANGSSRADFGPNQWLVDELYQRYQADPGSVDRAWWSFFADYQPSPDSAAAQSAAAPAAATATPAQASTPTAAPAAPPAPPATAPQPAPPPATRPDQAAPAAPPATPPQPRAAAASGAAQAEP